MSLAPGVLSVTVEFAKDIKNRAWIGRQDPYCIVRVGNHTFCTRTAVDGGRNPVWDETFEFNVENENDLVIEIKDDKVGADELLGSASCTLAQVRLSGSDWLELPVLSPDHGHPHQGIVGVSLRWTPTGASSNAAEYGYGEPEILAGAAAYSRVAQALPPPPYGVDTLQVEEVVELERKSEYPHRHHHHHHQGQGIEERW